MTRTGLILGNLLRSCNLGLYKTYLSNCINLQGEANRTIIRHRPDLFIPCIKLSQKPQDAPRYVFRDMRICALASLPVLVPRANTLAALSEAKMGPTANLKCSATLDSSMVLLYVASRPANQRIRLTLQKNFRSSSLAKESKKKFHFPLSTLRTLNAAF